MQACRNFYQQKVTGVINLDEGLLVYIKDNPSYINILYNNSSLKFYIDDDLCKHLLEMMDINIYKSIKELIEFKKLDIVNLEGVLNFNIYKSIIRFVHTEESFKFLDDLFEYEQKDWILNLCKHNLYNIINDCRYNLNYLLIKKVIEKVKTPDFYNNCIKIFAYKNINSLYGFTITQQTIIAKILFECFIKEDFIYDNFEKITKKILSKGFSVYDDFEFWEIFLKYLKKFNKSIKYLGPMNIIGRFIDFTENKFSMLCDYYNKSIIDIKFDYKYLIYYDDLSIVFILDGLDKIMDLKFPKKFISWLIHEQKTEILEKVFGIYLNNKHKYDIIPDNIVNIFNNNNDSKIMAIILDFTKKINKNIFKNNQICIKKLTIHNIDIINNYNRYFGNYFTDPETLFNLSNNIVYYVLDNFNLGQFNIDKIDKNVKLYDKIIEKILAQRCRRIKSARSDI